MCNFSYAQDYRLEIEKKRTEKNLEFKDKLTSPLTKKDRRKFKGLNYYDTDTKYQVSAVFTKLHVTDMDTFKMMTTTDRKPDYRTYGTLYFEIEEAPFTLIVYQSLDLMANPEFNDYLFIPFNDLTNNDETYGGGRFLDFKIPTSRIVTIDFNLAYNPYCDYNHKFSCPIPPSDNFLNIRIEAGEKKFHTYE